MRYAIINSRNGEVVAGTALLANNAFTRARGLLGRASLPPGEAIILCPASSIHMMFMRFAIDVIYLDRDGLVVKVVRNLRPWRFSAARGAHSVIEMAAGGLADLDLRLGDRMLVKQTVEGQELAT